MDKLTLDLAKALDTTTANGNNLLDPVLLSKVISTQVRRMPILRNMISRIPWSSNVYQWDSAVSEGVAQTYQDGATLAFSDAAWAQGLAKMSYFASVLAISGPAIKATELLLDVVSTRLDQASRTIMRLEGSAIFNGDQVNPGGFPGLNAALASVNQGYISTGVFGQLLLEGIDAGMQTNGYRADVVVMSPNAFAYLKASAYNKVRFLNPSEGPINIGFAAGQNTTALMFNGIPCVADPYAISYAVATAATMTAVSGSTTRFAFPNNNVQRAPGSNFAGVSWVAPVISVSGTVVTNYTYNPDGTVTFASAPAAAPTATYTYGQDNVYFLSLNPADLVIPENLDLTVESDLGKPAQYDGLYFRAKMYSTLVVRNPLAHVAVLNVSVPALGSISGAINY